MTERVGSDTQRLWTSSSIDFELIQKFNCTVVLCRIRPFPTLISKMKWLRSRLPLNINSFSLCYSVILTLNFRNLGIEKWEFEGGRILKSETKEEIVGHRRPFLFQIPIISFSQCRTTRWYVWFSWIKTCLNIWIFVHLFTKYTGIYVAAGGRWWSPAEKSFLKIGSSAIRQTEKLIQYRAIPLNVLEIKKKLESYKGHLAAFEPSV